MADYQTQSLLGANFGTPGSTADFTLLTRAQGSNDSVYVYVKVTSSCVTGALMQIAPAGTARVIQGTTILTALTALEFGFAQTSFSEGQYGWIAKQGNNLYVNGSGTLTAGSVLYLADTLGYVTNSSGSATLYGIAVITSVSNSGAVPNVTTAVISYPRGPAGSNF